MDTQTIRVLLIEDSHVQAQMVMAELAKASHPSFHIEYADRFSVALERLEQGGIDAILTDLELPDSTGLDTVVRLRAHSPAIALIVMTGTYKEEELGLEAIRQGAQDYVFKDPLDIPLVVRVVRYALERKRAEKIILTSAELLRQKAEAFERSNAELVEYQRNLQASLKDLGEAKARLEAQKESLEVANKRLQELGILKDEFVANVNHELRTPLTAIKEGISLMLDGALGAVNDDQLDFLKTVDDNIDRLTELISNMLDLSKIEAGRLRLLRRRLEIWPLIETTLNSYKAIAGPRTVQVDRAEVPAVFADPNRILQVLGNLFSNAVKFTKDNGTIRWFVHERDGQVAVSVQDDGVGMSKDELPELFEKFSQVGDGQTKLRSTGLGLTLCKELVELHRGQITVTSEPGKGSTFTFTLPLYTPAVALEASFEELVESARRTLQEAVGVIVLDNEPLLEFARGPQAGRRTERLEQVVEFVGKYLHHNDVVLSITPRWVVIVAITDALGVHAIVRRMQQALPQWPGTEAERRLAQRVSVGAALYPADGDDVHQLFAKAIERLGHGLPTATGTSPRPGV